MTEQQPLRPSNKMWGVMLLFLLLLPSPFLILAFPNWASAGGVFLALAVCLTLLAHYQRRQGQERAEQMREQTAQLRELTESREGLQQLLDKRTQKLNSINEVLMDMLNKLDLELEGVGEFQQSLLPLAEPVFKGYHFARFYQPCGRASGDYYDFLEINPNALGIVIADVSGHGSRASVVMAITRALMQTYALAYLSPARLLDRINRMMVRLVPTEEFITMFYCILNRSTNQLTYAAAGQPYALKINPHHDEVEYLDTANGVPLKILEEYDYTESQVQLNEGDRLILYTDGLIEATNPKGELFELERLTALCLDSRDKTINEQIEFITSKVVEFTEYDNLNDDFTIIGIEMTGAAESSAETNLAAAAPDSDQAPESKMSVPEDDIDLSEIPEF